MCARLFDTGCAGVVVQRTMTGVNEPAKLTVADMDAAIDAVLADLGLTDVELFDAVAECGCCVELEDRTDWYTAKELWFMCGDRIRERVEVQRGGRCAGRSERSGR